MNHFWRLTHNSIYLSLFYSCSLILYSCTEDDPAINEKLFLTVEIDADYDFFWDNNFVLVTTSDNQRIDYFEISSGEEYQVLADPSLDLTNYNVHYVSYENTSDELFFLESHIGLEGDKFTLTSTKSIGTVNPFKTVRIDQNTFEGYKYLAAVGPVFFTEKGFYNQGTFDLIDEFELYETSKSLYFHTIGLFESGYTFIPNFNPSNTVIDFREFDLKPLSEMTKLTLELPDNLRVIELSIDGLLNDLSQAPVKLYQMNGNTTLGLDVYFPDNESDIDRYKVYLRADDGRQKYISSMSTHTPGFPNVLNTQLDFINENPGEIEVRAEGEYTELETRIYSRTDAGRYQWHVIFNDEEADYASYPNFPAKFFEKVPYGTLENLRKESALPGFYSVTIEARHIDEKSTLRTNLSVN